MRRLLAVLCGVVLGLSAARPSGADVRPPVNVFIMGEPRSSVGGQDFTGTLTFKTGAALPLSNLIIKGEPASVRSIGGLLTTTEAGGSAEVDFTWRPSRDGEPLVISYDVGGITYEKIFDLSQEAVDRVRRPGTTSRIETVDPLAKPAGAELVSVAPAAAPAAPTEEEVRRREGGVERSTVQQVNARNIRVRGRWLYRRNDGALIGADGCTVRIYDNDSPWGSELLAQVATDAQGWYDVTFFWNPCAVFCDSEPDIYVEFRAENTEYVVKSTAFAAGAYSWATGTVNDYLGTDLDFGWLEPGAPGDHPAVHLLSTLTHGWRQHYWNGYDMTSMDCFWPEGTGGAYYNGAVHFSSGEQWIEGTIIHEQGHHWVANYGIAIAPDYCNGICDTPSCGHCVWCQETDHDAWAEGFPNWMGEWIPSTFPAVYGYAGANIGDGRYMLESLGSCGSTADPYRTENFLGALLHDIQDVPSDDHNTGDPWRDRLNLAATTIFTVADLDGPTTPANFLTKFAARYPAHKENFWETAKNCGYEFDVLPPGSVTGLASSSHTVGGNSADPTVDLYWTRASDDVSGVGGYGISVTAAPSFPAAVENLGNVTSYTTSALAPGTYYFNIRARDRAGRWSSSYATFGPFTIRLPVPANLTYNLFAGWSHPVVPRPAADGTVGSVPAPASLTGNSSSTFWNMSGRNTGEQSTGVGFQARAYVDGVWNWWVSWGAIGNGGGYYYNNGGPLNIRGGRHTFEVVHDALEEVAETNEGDNAWARQWVWSPLDVTDAPLTTRGAPPLRTAGWGSVVDGSPVSYNSDGLRFTTTGWWNAITLRPVDTSHDYDLRLHTASTGPTNGFDSYLQWSGRVDELDAVIVNRNVVGFSTWDVSAINWDGSPGNYIYEHVKSIGLSFNTVNAANLGDGQSMDLFECYLGTSEIGAVSFVVQITDPLPAGTPLKIRWLDQSFTNGNLGSLPGVSTDANGLARVDANVTTAGWHGLMVYREFDAGLAPINYTVRIHRTPPDFIPYTAAGWHSPFVPRPAFDGTPSSVPAPATLQGDAASTYFNFANINQSPTGAPSLYQQAYEDGVYGWWLAWGAYGPNQVGLFNWNAAWTVRGGRHLLSTIEDPNNEQEEIWETNNAYGQQWVWQPTQLAFGGTTTRGAPPLPAGGWDHGATGTLWWNADGLRTPSFNSSMGWWGGLALMPLGDSDFDPRLHEISTGAQNGFAASLAQSYFLEGQSDYVIANFNRTAFRAFDVGIVRYGSGVNNYHSEIVGSTYLGFDPVGLHGPYIVAANRVMNLHEVYLNPGRWEIDVMPGTGGVDWGMTLHGEDMVYGGKGDAYSGAIAYLEPPNQLESVIVDITTAGYYCVSVWKSKRNHFTSPGSYQLQFVTGTVDAPGPLAGRTSFRGAFPNPARGSTSLEFELTSEQEASLEVFDLHGAQVRTLSAGRRGPGLHRIPWSGEDDLGRKLTPGIYMVRFRAGSETTMRKVILLD